MRAAGSGNIGATNVARAVGIRLGVVTLLLDAAKGALPVIVARRFGLAPAVQAAVALAAISGHIFSPLAKFRGGKGVATAAGAFAALAPPVLLGSLAIFAAAAWRWRIVSLASLAAAAGLPIFAAVLSAPNPTRVAAVITAVALLATHRDNIRRLLNGTEPRFRPRAARTSRTGKS